MWWVVVQAVMFVFFIVALFAGSRIGAFTGRIYVQSAGLLLALVGSVLSAWALIEHRGSMSPFPAPRPGTTLRDSGPYRFVRHPTYTGIILFVLGASVAYMVPAAMLVAPAFFVFFLAKSAREEEMLLDAVPGYRQYRSAVPWRLIPKVV